MIKTALKQKTTRKTKATHSRGICSTTDALAWAGERIAIDKKRCVRNTPWSQVYRLEATGSTYYLKFAPPGDTAAPALLPKLAQRFPDRVCGVEASDPERGLVLMHAVSGTRLNYELSSNQRATVFANYAKLHAECSTDESLLAGLIRTDPVAQLDKLLEFLNPDTQFPTASGQIAHANTILGTDISARYYKPLLKRRALLSKYLKRANKLPLTLNHGDLRPPNTALHADNTCQLFDWDDASAGPAGLSLHGYLSGCSAIARLLDGDDLYDAEETSTKGKILSAYIDSLVDSGFASREIIEKSLGASACAGVMRYLLGYSRYELDDKDLRADTAEIFKKRLSDILDLCDYLSLTSRKHVILFTKDYMNRGRGPRAEWIVSRHLTNHPNDGEAHGLYAQLLHRRRSYSHAKSHYRNALEISPSNASLLGRQGDLYLEQLQFDKAITLYRRAINADSSMPIAERQLQLAFELKRAEALAKTPKGLPTITVSDKEFKMKKMGRAKHALAMKMFIEYGVLVINNVFEKKLIEQCRASFFKKYQPYFENKRHEDALRIGDKRFQVTMNVDGPVNSEGLYGNPLILPILKDCLDKNFVWGSLTASTSLPGSKEQWVHKDHPILFSDHKDLVLPPHGVSVMIPLVDLNPEVGTTKVKKKSHLKSLRDSKAIPSLTPYVDAGSCYLMDHRLTHKGEQNRSDTVRPVFNALYHRRWFRDSLNFKNQPPIKINKEEYKKVPKHLKGLLRWTKDNWPDLSKE